MRIDVLSIFPDYLAPLDLSLIGRARREGLLEVQTHDLRDWTHDRHRTIDDSPYGGGPGMVMRPEPWGEALDEVCGAQPSRVPHLVLPAPGGTPFTQDVAEALAAEPWLVFGCGRYEGIDERVHDEYADRMPVSVLSLGDYVVNGGEVAALAMIEAIARLLPGVIGNAESLVEESHTGGLLEYPVYTKPPLWRGRAVPPVLRSGDHGAIAAWREAQRLERTARRRPDLLNGTATLAVDDLAGLDLRLAVPADAGEILTLSRACWLQEGRDHDSFAIPALTDDLDQARADLSSWRTWVVRAEGRLIGSVRARAQGPVWDIGRLMVAPDLQGRGLGRALLKHAEAAAPEGVTGYALITGAQSVANLRMYRRAGYRLGERSTYRGVPTVALHKRRRTEPHD